MPAPLQLRITDYRDETQWRWELADAQGRFLADHEVALDKDSREYRGFLVLRDYLDFYQPVHPPAEQLRTLGAWIGAEVFGGLKDALLAEHEPPATAVRVQIPQEAEPLLLRPFELARLAGPASPALTELGIRLVYQLADKPDGARAKAPVEQSLRVLAVFSLPDKAKPLNLRRERYQLQALVRTLNQTQGKAVELRIVQYGATRASLRDLLEEAPGWDLVQLSGHGEQGEILIETEAGGVDRIRAEELAELLRPSRARLKLLILDACYSGAASHAAARAQLGMELSPERQDAAADLTAQESAATVQTVLPSLAQTLVGALDCAALAMRYPVGDSFATELMLALYEKLLSRGQPLPAALHLALKETLARDETALPQAVATPILFGRRAAALHLAPPDLPPGEILMPRTGLMYFPPDPPRLVGRLGPLLRGSLALAPKSEQRGVLFYGMAGAGKSACALELSYRHQQGRFRGQVWYRAPEEGSDIGPALFNLMLEIERQLAAPNLGLAAHLDEPERFRAMILPRFGALLEQRALLLVLDNLETLLTGTDRWRDPLWGAVIATLLGHKGHSRLILTSRRLPTDLEDHPRLQREAIHALSFAESVLLARELPHLKALFATEADKRLLVRTLRLVQGHPKLLELADGRAADRAALERQIAAGEAQSGGRKALLEAFFAVTGRPDEGETRQGEADFVATLHRWTDDVAAGLPPVARLLLQFLSRLEPEDRTQEILEANWENFLTRIQGQTPAAALAEADQGLAAARAALASAGLLEVDETVLEPGMRAQGTTLRVHPGVAEAVRAGTDDGLLAAADSELGDYHVAMAQRGAQTEQMGGDGQVVSAGRRGAPYLLRLGRWQDASNRLEQMLTRDASPETLAFAIPLLERIVAETRGTDRALIDAGVLASALGKAGRYADAEPALRRVIADAVAAQRYRTAWVGAGNLLSLLISTGHLQAALQLAEEIAGYSRDAGLGPWARLLDEAHRLQVLNAMGRYQEVLDRVESLRPELAALPEPGDADAGTYPWMVREGLLTNGREAAQRDERWEKALALSAEQIELMEQRDAGALDRAIVRFNDYFPLLRLGRHQACRALLQDCRAVFEAEHHIEMLGKVYSALAELQGATGDLEGAVGFEQLALRFSYQAGQPEGCAISHNNLTGSLERLESDPEGVLAHQLAAAVLWIQTGSGNLPVSIRNLAAKVDLPAEPPSFETVAAWVEQVEGVRFRALFAALPAAYPDGDTAIAAVWQQALAERQKGQALRRTLPPELSAAFEAGDEQAMAKACAALTPEQQAAALAILRGSGLLPDKPTEPPIAADRPGD